MHKRISYNINDKAPGWPGNPIPQIEPYTLIFEGEVANQYQVTMPNHFGSHMDGPKHFNDQGPRLAEMPLETFIYDNPLLLDIPKSFHEMVTVQDLEPYESQIKKADLLMIRSGFSVNRTDDPKRYASEGPAISSEACKYMMDHFPQLKAVALDWISLASYAHLPDGILAHQYLLGSFHDHYICIIEDLNFAELEADQLRRVLSIPLFIDSIDSSPVTVIAEL
jgi:arylformamidase